MTTERWWHSDCGHAQTAPTDAEIDGCPEVIVRDCRFCGGALWWNIDRWRYVTRPVRVVQREPGGHDRRTHDNPG